MKGFHNFHDTASGSIARPDAAPPKPPPKTASRRFDDRKAFPPPPMSTGGDEEPPGPELTPAPPKELGIPSEGADRLGFVSERPDTEYML